MSRSHPASVISAKAGSPRPAIPTFTMPALFTTTSMRPNSSRTRSTIATRPLAVGEVRHEAGSLGAAGMQLAGALLDPIGRRGDRDGGSLPREHPGARETDPRWAARTGDQRDPSSLRPACQAAYRFGVRASLRSVPLDGRFAQLGALVPIPTQDGRKSRPGGAGGPPDGKGGPRMILRLFARPGLASGDSRPGAGGPGRDRRGVCVDAGVHLRW